MYEVMLGYIVGTLVGVVLFRMYVKERIVSATLDMLIQEEYVRAWIDDEGTTQLYKWHEVDQQELWNTIEEIITDMENGNETDDSA